MSCESANTVLCAYGLKTSFFSKNLLFPAICAMIKKILSEGDILCAGYS